MPQDVTDLLNYLDAEYDELMRADYLGRLAAQHNEGVVR